MYRSAPQRRLLLPACGEKVGMRGPCRESEPAQPTISVRLTSRSKTRSGKGAHPHGAEAGTDDVRNGELDHRDRQLLRLDQAQDRVQAGGFIEIALAHVAIDDHGAVLAHACKKHL